LPERQAKNIGEEERGRERKREKEKENSASVPEGDSGRRKANIFPRREVRGERERRK